MNPLVQRASGADRFGLGEARLVQEALISEPHQPPKLSFDETVDEPSE